jgi:uncharacterized membrane protein YuzA (DUF378 family)
MSNKLEQVAQHIPNSATLNWVAAITGLASFLTTWVPIVVGVLSGIWICVQLWLVFFVTKPWKKKERS